MGDNTVRGFTKRTLNQGEALLDDLTDEYGQKVRGRVNDAVETAQQSYGDAITTLRETVSEQPLIALLTAVSVGLFAGIFLSRR